jgi:hypothetical protein
MKASRILVLPLFLLFGLQVIDAQEVEIRGILIDQQSGKGIAEGTILAGDMAVSSNLDGSFVFRINRLVDTLIIIQASGFDAREYRLPEGLGSIWQMGEVRLQPAADSRTRFISQDIPVIELTEADFDESATGNISALLQASRDPFVRAAAFQFSAARFRIRGYESRYTTTLLNGVTANNPQNGDVFWSQWAGLNDVMRPQENLVGLVYVNDAMANMGGMTSFDTRAHRQRKQTRVSYAISNRTFTNRLMATHSTGWNDKGWAFSLSGSRRWAQEGFIKGTFFDGYAYFASVDKRIKRNHILNLTVLGSPLVRGRSIANTMEQNEIAGTNFYNPYWGFQNGEVRNSRFVDTHQPIGILRYDWNINRNSRFLTSLSWQGGRYGSSAIDWYDARDPRADYYRRWPSSMPDPGMASRAREALIADENLRQVDWHYMYEVNRNGLTTIPQVDGIPGNDVTGLRSRYILQEFRSDPTILQGRMVYQTTIKGRHFLSAGLQGQQQSTHYFQNALDLLGGDFWVDWSRFAEFDFPNDINILQNNIDQPNRLVREGDRFGYDYKIHAQNYQGWVQSFLSGAHFDGFIGGELGYADFYREGLIRNGRFPETSGGNSDLQSFLTWKAKGGITWKIDGRNYINVAGFTGANAPDFTNGFISPRTRNDLVEDLPAERITSAEASYRLQAPTVKFRVTAYVTDIRDQTNVITFFNDLANTFGNYVLTDINRRHIGTEWGAEWKITPAIELNAAAALGQFYYTDRAKAKVIEDNTGQEIYRDRTVYIRNFRMDGMPQEAFSLGVTYNSRKFWFANLQVNYFRRAFLDFSPDRRTAQAVDGVEPGSAQWRAILDQEELPGGFLVNAFGGKSWKVRQSFVYLNVGVTNLLNRTDFITGGFEQLRFDNESRQVGRFPNRYFYAFGFNYFINLSVRI